MGRGAPGGLQGKGAINATRGALGRYGARLYAGHGIQHQGENYLMPVDVRIEDETDRRQLTRAEEVIGYPASEPGPLHADNAEEALPTCRR